MADARRGLGFAGWVALPFLAAWFGSRFPAAGWYAELQKPEWSPPAWVFGPVWTVLYLLMGIAAGLVWKRYGFSGARTALGLFLAQLVLNALWSWLFFGLRLPGLAFGEIVVLGILILATAIAFWRKRPVAGALLVPYLLWVAFAAALNFSIWRLNAL